VKEASTGAEVPRQPPHRVSAGVDTAIDVAAERRHEIESELLALSRLDGGRAKVVRAGARGMVAVKVGKKPKASTPKQPKKPRKASKTRKAAHSVISTLAGTDHIEPLPIETSSVASIDANVIPADLSAAA
jgi:hypothetical protein